MTDGDQPHDQPPARTRRRFYGWRLVWAGAFIIGIGVSLPSIVTLPEAGQGVIFVGAAALLLAALSPFVGWVIDRWGARRMALLAMAGLGGSFVMLFGAQVTAVAYLPGVLMQYGGPSVLKMSVVAAANNWFRRRRATAMAIVMLPSIVAVVIVSFLPIAAHSVTGGDSSVVLLVIGAFILAIAWPLSRLVLNRPEDYDQHPDGIAPEPDVAAPPDYTWREALRTRVFWFMTLGQAFIVSGFGALMFSFALLMNDMGFSVSATASVLTLTLLIPIPFGLAGGILGDRIPIRWAIFAFTLLGLTGLIVFSFARTLPMLFLALGLASAGMGAIAPLSAAMYGAYFGRSNFATISGMSELAPAFMSVAAPVLIGVVYDAEGGFTWSAVILAVMVGAGSLLFAMLGAPRLPPSQRRLAEVWDLSGPA